MEAAGAYWYVFFSFFLFIELILVKKEGWREDADDRDDTYLLGIPHAVEKDDVYNGYFIPAGATIHALEW